MGVVDRMLRLDRRWIFAAMWLAVSIPLWTKLEIGVRPSPEVRAFHEAIERLPEGSVIYLAADLDPGSQAELDPMLRVAVAHACRKNLKVIGAALWPAAPPILERAFNEIAVGEFGKEYGRDFVNLGFKEGREAVMVMVAEDIRAAYPADYYRTPLDQIPLMADIRGFGDVALLVNISAGYPGTKEWVQQVQGRFSVDMVSGCTAVSAPEYYPYVQAGQLDGLLGGLAGAAEYETLADRLGEAARGMNAQSLGHLAVVLFILVGNVLHVLGRRREKAVG